MSQGIILYAPYVIRAWKWLFSQLVIAASISYLVTFMVGYWGVAEPLAILNTTTAGIRHVGKPILTKGTSLGIDPGVMTFICNFSVALLILVLLLWVRMLNPHNRNSSYLRLRTHLQKDRSSELLRKFPPFSRIESPQLRLTSFLLIGAPTIAVVVLGLMTGALFGTAHLLSSSPLLAMAYLLPHGIPEVAGLLLACSIPAGTWMFIRADVFNGRSELAFRRVERVATSRHLQKNIRMIVTLLMIAGLVEAHFTLKIVAFLSRI